MSKKDEIQRLIKDKLLLHNLKGIVLSSVRSGKTRILLEAIKEHSEKLNPKVLVLYPNKDIKSSWEKECTIINYYPDISYCTFISIEKVQNLIFDYVILDECHLLAEETQLKIASFINKRHKHCIFASGTYSEITLQNLIFNTGLDLIVNYTTEDAIKDEIVCDFKVYIHQYNLDSATIKEFGKVKKWKSTELKECNRLTHKVNTTSGKEKFFHALNRMRFINSCESLVNCVNDWIKINKNERFILFTGDEKVGKLYNLPMYNSKSKDDSILKQFQNEEINQLCLIKKGKAGITYPNLKIVLLTAIDSNSENIEQAIGRSLLNDTDKAEIHIFISFEQFQLKWLTSALENIPKDKIQYI